MKTFYERQRRRLQILVDQNEPVGGKWSFDEDNRERLPNDIYIHPLPLILHDEPVQDVIELVQHEFANHPGDPKDFWLPTNRAQALAWFHDFLQYRFAEFGPYEDALSSQHATINHSILSPLLNCGLLTPAEVIREAVAFAQLHDIPVQSVEGFVRQIIGWREFIKGIADNFEHTGNFWKHSRQLAPTWYTAQTGIPPLDHIIKKILRTGYAHHIERLMVVGNIMLLTEIDPKAAHRWFMELFVDSADWVMGPNVHGMSMMADGGLFTTKPYICGSNYILTMSDYAPGFWCDVLDGLYWRFVEKHQAYFASNPRLAVMPKALQKLDPERKRRILAAAEAFIRKNTI